MPASFAPEATVCVVEENLGRGGSPGQTSNDVSDTLDLGSLARERLCVWNVADDEAIVAKRLQEHLFVKHGSHLLEH